MGDVPVLALAPLAVSIEYQHQGIGSALIQQGHQLAKKLGFNYVVVLGDPAYYLRFGYQNAEHFGIKAPFDVPSEYFMVLPLHENLPPLNDTMRYATEFEMA